MTSASASIAQMVSRPELLRWISGRNRMENQSPFPAADSQRLPRCPLFFFSSRRRHTRLQGDWGSDVCSSDLVGATCLVTSRKAGHDQDPSLGASATLCLSAQGAILRAETAAGTLSAASYSTDIPGDADRKSVV